MVFLSFLITGFLVCCHFCSTWYKKIKKHEKAETWWTVLPGVWVFILSFPSLEALYKMEVQKGMSNFLVEVTGNQWYWHYKYDPNFWLRKRYTHTEALHSRAGPPHYWEFAEDEALTPRRKKKAPFEYTSYMKKDHDLKEGEFRLMDVDHRVFMPSGSKTLFSVTSEDVIHSWYVPSLGIKMDAVPGKNNIFRLLAHHSGVFYGMCAELCGVNHSYMPIVVEALHIDKFRKWEICKSVLAMYGRRDLLPWALPEAREVGPIFGKDNYLGYWPDEDVARYLKSWKGVKQEETPLVASPSEAVLPEAAMPEAGMPEPILPEGSPSEAGTLEEGLPECCPECGAPKKTIPSEVSPSEAVLPEAAMPEAGMPEPILPEESPSEAVLPEAGTLEEGLPEWPDVSDLVTAGEVPKEGMLPEGITSEDIMSGYNVLELVVWEDNFSGSWAHISAGDILLGCRLLKYTVREVFYPSVMWEDDFSGRK